MKKHKKRARILAFSGAWSDMSEEDFEDLQNYIKEVRENMAKRFAAAEKKLHL